MVLLCLTSLSQVEPVTCEIKPIGGQCIGGSTPLKRHAVVRSQGEKDVGGIIVHRFTQHDARLGPVIGAILAQHLRHHLPIAWQVVPDIVKLIVLSPNIAARRPDAVGSAILDEGSSMANLANIQRPSGGERWGDDRSRMCPGCNSSEEQEHQTQSGLQEY